MRRTTTTQTGDIHKSCG